MQPVVQWMRSATRTDYIYANGKKIAKVDSQKPIYHMHGTPDQATPNLACDVQPANSDMLKAIAGKHVMAGDVMVYDVRQTSTGPALASGFAILLQGGGG